MRTETLWNGWRGVALVAITYIYFLIFAQFGFLKRLAALGIEGNHLKAVMGAMAAGGVLSSLLAPRLPLRHSPQRRLQVALFGCALAAASTTSTISFAQSIGVSFLIGAALGLLTVTLVTHLPHWTGLSHPLVQVGLGTGIGYFVCNFPPLFNALPRTQAIVSAALCVAGCGIAMRSPTYAAPETAQASVKTSALPFPLVLACFTALVWLDSAAFFIIQNTPQLKAGAWQGAPHLWSNGLLHFFAALAAARLIRSRGVAVNLAAGFAILACACLVLNNPAHLIFASILYPIGVSLYSVALVAYPSFLASAPTLADRAIKAGWIYAIAGWVGSALGIGMAQNLGHVPPLFVLCAAMVFLVPWLWRFVQWRMREAVITLALLIGALAAQTMVQVDRGSELKSAPTLVGRGREVYISEGCINCHSQYVRPHSPDVLMWGPASSVEALRAEKPPLIGNRRQGPDLSEVGDRRSKLWLKAHFFDPAEVSHASFMPAYGYLFTDERGDALIAYLKSLGSESALERQIALQQTWRPSSAAVAKAASMNGAELFHDYCSTCHSPTGGTRLSWYRSFVRLPPDLASGPFLYVPPSNDTDARELRLSQIIKFGIANTDMPGHEYLPDSEVAALANWVAGLTQPSSGQRFNAEQAAPREPDR